MDRDDEGTEPDQPCEECNGHHWTVTTEGYSDRLAALPCDACANDLGEGTLSTSS